MNVAVVGAGILGLAHAYAYARRGHRVRVYERSLRASGASVRNFGMIWPIGQPSGPLCDMAMLSRELWLDVLEKARLPYKPTGSLHLTYREDEEAVACEFAAKQPERARWIPASEVLAISPAANPNGLRGAVFSKWEMVVDPQLTLSTLPCYLSEQFGVEFRFGTVVTEVKKLEADLVIVCSGDDFETLYPEVFASSGITRCKLQMMRTVPQPGGWQLGPALSGGLSMGFYRSFEICDSLAALKRRFELEMSEYGRWGIHVMASQMADGAITIGDSHQYDLAVDIFNKEEIDRLILKYLKGIAQFPTLEIAGRWFGVYSSHPERRLFQANPEPGVYIVTASAGKGMTISFGLAEMLYENPGREF